MENGAVDQIDVRLKLNDRELSWLPVDEQIVVLDLRSSRYMSLNDSAARLWSILAGGGTFADLVAALQQAYGIDQERAAGDTAAFLDGLRDRGLLDEAG
jgi:hypothetical protein